MQSRMFVGIDIEIEACTDVGRSREHNEDNFIVANLANGETGVAPRASLSLVADAALLMVADGVGGAVSGEIASEMSVQTVWQHLQADAEDGKLFGGGQTPNSLRNAILAANSAIYKKASALSEHKGMATTATVAVIAGNIVYIAQVGDSRGYLIRDGVARQVTKDQSLIQRLVDAGRLTPEQAEQSDKKNIILQALGTEPSVNPEITRERFQSGDILLLCSDGLSNMVKPDDIARAVLSAPNLEEACNILIDQANNAGGTDNITAVLARISSPETLGGITQPIQAIAKG